MAEQLAHDVVNQAQSMDDLSSIGDSGQTHTSNTSGGESAVPVDGNEKVSALESPGTKQNEFSQPNGITSTDASTGAPTDRMPVTLSNDLSQDISHMVNGDSMSHVGSDDLGYQHSTGADTGAGSDTDTSRGEILGQPKDEARHERSNSVSLRKPAAFKSVSVTKNFLAKSGATAATTAKLTTEKASPGAQAASLAQPSALKPRLVAKTGRDARTLSSGTASGTPAGPDASTVWNRNKPVQPPPPKQFTDEELKQQYGIHMATRLQADEAGKESKWADIDDDEDNWVPDPSVLWMDGTKSTIRQDEQVGGSTEPQDLAKAEPEEEDPAKATSDAQASTSTISGPGKTILRPGARSNSMQLKPGLILKSVPEKPAAEPKPTPQTNSRSPWAPLPPVDKASPITFNPPAPSRLPHFPPRDPQASEHALVSPSPAKEMAADDFDRSWHDGERGNRELFNSQSGRYEPVKERRRGSRTESGYRAPAVLQRPGQSGYPEPSAAFQTSRNSGSQDRPWNRRRGSSSVEDRNAPQERRVSSDQGEPSPSQRANEPVPNMAQQSIVTSSLAPPSQHDEANLARGPQAYAAHGPPHGAPHPEPSEADLRAVQKTLMLERAKASKKRKEEEEQKEEAARKERIRQKLESLGPAPSSAKEAKAQQQLERQADDIPLPPPADVKQSQQQDSPQPLVAPPTSITKTTPEQPSSNVVQPPADGDGAALSIEPLLPIVSQSQPPAHIKDQSQPLSKSLSDSNSPSLPRPHFQNQHSHPQDSLSSERRIPQGSWNNPSLGVDNSASWNNIGMPPHPPTRANVWGPVSSDKNLGNGVFEAGLRPYGYAPMQRQKFVIPPGAIGQPSASPNPPAESIRGPPGMNQAVGQPRPNISLDQYKAMPSTGSGQQLDNDARTHPYAQPPAVQNSNARAHPYAQAPPGPRTAQAVRNKWASVPDQLAKENAVLREKADREAAARAAEEARTGVRPEFAPAYNVTFIPSKASDKKNDIAPTTTQTPLETKVVPTESETTNLVAAPIQPPVGALPANLAAQNIRASRFFGPGSELSLQQPLAARSPIDDHASPYATPQPSPDSTQSLFGEDSTMPSVKLPQIPKVKLPPAQTSTSATNEPVIMPMRPQSMRGGSQAIVNQEGWQDRFNSLLGKKSTKSSSVFSSGSGQLPSPPKAPALAISSVSIGSLDPTPKITSATVSLPQAPALDKAAWNLPEDQIETKPKIEDWMDVREFGSSPEVSLPPPSSVTMDSVSSLYSPTPRFGGSIAQAEMHSSFSRTMSPNSIEGLLAPKKTEGGTQVEINLHGLATIKILIERVGEPAVARPFKDNRKPYNSNKKKQGGRKPSATGDPSGISSPATSGKNPKFEKKPNPYGSYGGAGNNQKSQENTSNPQKGTSKGSTYKVKNNGWAVPPKGARKQEA